MRWLMYAPLLVTTMVASAQGASNVSAKFDGIYEGEATPAVALEQAGCSAFAAGEVVIANGILKSRKTDGSPTITGFITEEGYVAAFMTRAGHQRSAMDGRHENCVIGVGFIESDSGCAWVVHLQQKQANQ